MLALTKCDVNKFSWGWVYVFDGNYYSLENMKQLKNHGFKTNYYESSQITIIPAYMTTFIAFFVYMHLYTSFFAERFLEFNLYLA